MWWELRAANDVYFRVLKVYESGLDLECGHIHHLLFVCCGFSIGRAPLKPKSDFNGPPVRSVLVSVPLFGRILHLFFSPFWTPALR